MDMFSDIDEEMENRAFNKGFMAGIDSLACDYLDAVEFEIRNRYVS
jgi:hypothetical protein